MSSSLLRSAMAVLLLGLLVGCPSSGSSSSSVEPVATLLVPAQLQAQRLVVVLPGRGDDLATLQRSGIAMAIQGAWPDADVVLAELSLRYYLVGQAPQRLHEDVMVPARQRGYREVWLSGASMGGMGTLLYDRAYPGQLDGMVLLAPYLGDGDILREISAAGGVAHWNPGPPQEINGGNWQRELWRHVRSWGQSPDKARNVWLAYGDRDRLRDAMPLLEPVLRKEHVLVRRGGHAWVVWTPAARAVLDAVSDESAR